MELSTAVLHSGQSTSPPARSAASSAAVHAAHTTRRPQGASTTVRRAARHTTRSSSWLSCGRVGARSRGCWCAWLLQQRARQRHGRLSSRALIGRLLRQQAVHLIGRGRGRGGRCSRLLLWRWGGGRIGGLACRRCRAPHRLLLLRLHLRLLVQQQQLLLLLCCQPQSRSRLSIGVSGCCCCFLLPPPLLLPLQALPLLLLLPLERPAGGGGLRLLLLPAPSPSRARAQGPAPRRLTTSRACESTGGRPAASTSTCRLPLTPGPMECEVVDLPVMLRST